MVLFVLKTHISNSCPVGLSNTSFCYKLFVSNMFLYFFDVFKVFVDLKNCCVKIESYKICGYIKIENESS